MTDLTRRKFIKSASLAGSALLFTPSYIYGKNSSPSANNKLNIAGIGIGGMGKK
jgi:hypothetical protein